MIEEFHRMAVEAGIKKMLEGKHFSICDLEAALVITGGQMSKRDQAAFRAIHCMDWADMSPELRKMTFDKIMEVLNAEPFFNLECIPAKLAERFACLPGGKAH